MEFLIGINTIKNKMEVLFMNNIDEELFNALLERLKLRLLKMIL